MKSTGAPRWVVFATEASEADHFAAAVQRAGDGWKPFAIHPKRMEAAIQAIRPEVVVLDPSLPGAGDLLHRTRQTYGGERVVLETRDFSALTNLLQIGTA